MRSEVLSEVEIDNADVEIDNPDVEIDNADVEIDEQEVEIIAELQQCLKDSAPSTNPRQ